MHESNPDKGEFSPTAQAISTAMRAWLAAEIVSSSTHRNAYLDDFTAMQKTYHMPVDATDNLNGLKAISHHNRLIQFMPAFVAEPANDMFAARELFFIQINISGLFRKQCIFQSSSQEDYEWRRIHSGSVVGIDMLPVIENQLSTNNSTHLDIEELASSTLVLNEGFLELNTMLHAIGAEDLSLEQSPSVTALKEQQEAWVRVAADHIVFAAQVRGHQLERVPFWEAKGMSDDDTPHAIYYPFAV